MTSSTPSIGAMKNLDLQELGIGNLFASTSMSAEETSNLTTAIGQALATGTTTVSDLMSAPLFRMLTAHNTVQTLAAWLYHLQLDPMKLRYDDPALIPYAEKLKEMYLMVSKAGAEMGLKVQDDESMEQAAVELSEGEMMVREYLLGVFTKEEVRKEQLQQEIQEQLVEEMQEEVLEEDARRRIEEKAQFKGMAKGFKKAFDGGLGKKGRQTKGTTGVQSEEEKNPELQSRETSKTGLKGWELGKSGTRVPQGDNGLAIRLAKAFSSHNFAEDADETTQSSDRQPPQPQKEEQTAKNHPKASRKSNALGRKLAAAFASGLDSDGEGSAESAEMIEQEKNQEEEDEKFNAQEDIAVRKKANIGTGWARRQMKRKRENGD